LHRAAVVAQLRQSKGGAKMINDPNWLVAMSCYYLPLIVMAILIGFGLAKGH